jgi:hypothetical protein
MNLIALTIIHNISLFTQLETLRFLLNITMELALKTISISRGNVNSMESRKNIFGKPSRIHRSK